MRTTIYFDMDGTIANLYGVENWLEMLLDGNATPYEIATPLVDTVALANRLNALQNKGYRLGVISWLSKGSTPDYDTKVIKAKLNWLKRNLGTVNFDTIKIVAYGTPKANYARTENDILFDDEIGNRENWSGRAYDVNNILGVLARL
jgi:hypothetical protein